MTEAGSMRIHGTARWFSAIALVGCAFLAAAVLTLLAPSRIAEAACQDDPNFGVTSIDSSLVPPSVTCRGVTGAERMPATKQEDGAMAVGLIGTLAVDGALIGVAFWASRRLLSSGTR